MKVKVSTQGNTDAAKQVKINESTRKHTPEIYEKLVLAIRDSWELDADIEHGQNNIADILYQYNKDEGKEAIKMILEEDMEVFQDQKKSFRVYAQTILAGGKKQAKHRIKENEEVVDRLVAYSEQMKIDLAKPKTAHPFGTGVKRIENEIRHRPRFFMEDLKFKVLRAVGVY